MGIRRLLSGVAAFAAALCAASPAGAGDNDLVLARLGKVVEDDGGMPVDAVGSNLEFRGLASELGVVMAPRLLTPSDTLGFGGFQFTADLAFTTIDNRASYWRARASSRHPTDPAGTHGKSVMPTAGFFVRKGIWLPLPSFEFGAGAVHLLDSSIWAAQGYVKFAMHEGFHDLPLPSASVRGGASRVMGTDQLDLTVASLDVSVSKDLGVLGTYTVSPYAGWNLLWIVPRSEVLDKTPHIDALENPADLAMSFAFRDQDRITRHRLLAGVKLHYHLVQLTLEAVLALSGSSIDDQPGTDTSCAASDATTAHCDAEDPAGAQQTYTVSIGFDF